MAKRTRRPARPADCNELKCPLNPKVLLDEDLQDVNRWIERLENGIDRFANAATTFTGTLAAHATRLDAVDAMSKLTREDFSGLRSQQQTDFKYLNDRIDDVQTKLTETMAKQTTEIKEHIDTTITSLSAPVSKNTTRIEKLEQWRWSVVGAAGVITFIFGIFATRMATSFLTSEVVLKFFHLIIR